MTELRRRAKAKLAEEPTVVPKVSPEECQKALHELQTHQLELEMQNEELRRVQSELKNAHDRFSGLFDFAPVGFVTVSGKGLIVEANLTLAKMLGIHRLELIGQLFSAFIVPDDQDIFYRHHRALPKTEERGVCELRLQRRDGSESWVEMVSAVELGSGPDIRRWRSAVSDCTARKEAEEERRKLHETLLEVLEETHRMATEAEAANRAKSDFLANMSHEIRTPLSGMLGMLSLLISTSLTVEQRSYAETAHASTDVLLRVIGDILDFSKIEAGEFGLESLTFDPHVLVQQVVDPLRLAAREKGLVLSGRVGLEVSTSLRGDALRLRQILTNLLNNAIKFTPAGEVSTWVELLHEDETRAGLRFTVLDTGIGIAADHLETLFDPFTQADATTTRRFGGTGLGLSIVSHLVGLMGGEVSVSSVEGEGSTFSFTVDLEKVPADTAHSKSEEAELEPVPLRSAASDGHSLRILVVEDEPVNKAILLAFLNNLGFETDSVSNGQLALAGLKLTPYSLVFMDCQMPEMDGYEATRAIRRVESAVLDREIPIIAVTAHAMQGERKKCLEAGMSDYITKPIRAAELDRVLRQWL